MSSIHEIPFVRIAIPFGVGIVIGDYWDIPIRLLFIMIAILFGILAAIFFAKANKNFFYPLSAVLLTLTGLSYIQIYDNFYSQEKLPLYEDYFFEGIVENLKQTKTGYSCDYAIKNYFDIHTKNVKSFNCRLYISNYSKEISNGDKLTVAGSLFPIPKNKNPHSFDYKNFLRHQGIFNQINIKGEDVIFHNISNEWHYLPTRLNAEAQNILKRLACCKESAGIAIGMITGNKNEIPSHLLDTYSKVGTMHLLAVSGLHVGIISGILFVLLGEKKSYIKKVWSIVLIMLVIWAFVFFTGAKTSTIRAGTMFSLLYISMISDRLYNRYNVIATSAFITLIASPHSIFEVGFQLSYLAVLSIFIFYPCINNLIDCSKQSFLIKKGWSIITLSISANILILPLSVFYFNQIPLSFVLSNLVAVPMAGFIVLGGFLMIILELILPVFNEVYALVYYFFISLTNSCLTWISKIPYTIIENIWIDKIHLTLIYGGLGFIMLVLAKNKLSLFKYSIACLIALIIYNNTETISRYNKTQFVVYDIFGSTSIDFALGNKSYYLSDNKLTKKSLDFNITQNRIANSKTEIIDISALDTFNNHEIIRRKSLIVFANKLFFAPTSQVELLNIPNETDYLIINHTHGIKNLNINTKTKVILPNDKYLNKWTLGIPENQLIRISRHGAFTQILEDV